MKIDIYRRANRRNTYGAVPAGNGTEALPGEDWEKFKEIDLEAGQPRIGLNPQEVLDGIASRGAHVWGVNITFEEGFAN